MNSWYNYILNIYHNLPSLKSYAYDYILPLVLIFIMSRRAKELL